MKGSKAFPGTWLMKIVSRAKPRQKSTAFGSRNAGPAMGRVEVRSTTASMRPCSLRLLASAVQALSRSLLAFAPSKSGVSYGCAVASPRVHRLRKSGMFDSVAPNLSHVGWPWRTLTASGPSWPSSLARPFHSLAQLGRERAAESQPALPLVSASQSRTSWTAVPRPGANRANRFRLNARPCAGRLPPVI